MNHSILAEIDQYFKTVTAAQLDADLKEAGYEFFSKIGSEIYVPRTYANLAAQSAPDSRVGYTAVTQSMTAAGTFEEMPCAA